MHGASFRHELLEYSGEEGFLRRTLPYISHALAADQPVLVAVAGEKLALLKEALGDDATRVGFAEMHALGRNPGRIISAWHEFLRQLGQPHRYALGIGEPIWPGRSAAELTECHRHESLINVVFDGGQPWHLLCPYDVDGLDDQVIEAAQRSHPFVADRESDAGTPSLPCTPASPGPFEGTLSSPTGEVQEMSFTAEGLATVRHSLTAWATGEMLGTMGTEELVLAVNELATNSVRYGGGSGRLLLWHEAGTLLCEVQDAGHIQDPLIGRTRPAPDQHSGRGLWLVHQLCDLVQIRSSPAGTVIRVHKHRDGESERPLA